MATCRNHLIAADHDGVNTLHILPPPADKIENRFVMDTQPFFFLAQAFLYPEKADLGPTARALMSLAADCSLNVSDQTSLFDLPLEEMQAEYVRLFINAFEGGVAHPYASIYIQNMGILRQQGYDEAFSFYREAGLDPIENGESADHISHELTFVGMLLDSGADDILLRFLNNHLLRWYPLFLQRLQDARPSSFYSVLAQVTDLCLKQLKKEVVDEQKALS